MSRMVPITPHSPAASHVKTTANCTTCKEVLQALNYVILIIMWLRNNQVRPCTTSWQASAAAGSAEVRNAEN